ncbi:ROK family protein [Microbacterium sp. 4R-513]|uniref:ROK family transcriptional regulator n=1 Tax=Microbacterium sp. 4R-513 TaxID=2567934 RepID=UPI0013E19AF3|nr:ROK family transcriptional regulator [Microbacterium sp. 4R-513]QIG39440.1 ROK family protein [Microbacterium sp. 4R-513]
MSSTGGDPSFLRRLNSSATLKALHDETFTAPDGHGAGLSVTQLAEAIGVSRPTAEEAVDALHTAGWVDVLAPVSLDRRSAGRPARRFRFRENAGYVVGVDVEATAVAVAVADLAGTVVGRIRRDAPPLLPADARLALIRDSIGAVLRTARVAKKKVLGGAAGSTGIVDPDGRIVRNSLPGWEGIHLADELSRMIGAPASAYNHLRLGALGERWRGAAQHADHVVHLHAGQRMGLGIVVAGRPLVGAHGAGGEFDLRVGRGWLDAYLVLLEHPLGVTLTEFSAGVGGDLGDARPIFSAAATGDESARDAVASFTTTAAELVAPIISAFDPEVVVIAGDLALAGDVALEPVRKVLELSGVIPPEVRVSTLGEESISLGAIRSALDEVEERLFEPPFPLVSV